MALSFTFSLSCIFSSCLSIGSSSQVSQPLKKHKTSYSLVELCVRPVLIQLLHSALPLLFLRLCNPLFTETALADVTSDHLISKFQVYLPSFHFFLLHFIPTTFVLELLFSDYFFSITCLQWILLRKHLKFFFFFLGVSSLVCFSPFFPWRSSEPLLWFKLAPAPRYISSSQTFP